MSRKKKLLILVGLLFVTAIVFRTAIYNSLTFYDITKSVESIRLTNPKLIHEIDSYLDAEETFTINGLVKKSLAITSNTLRFSKSSETTDPNKFGEHPKTHCVGYAALANSLINYGLAKMGATSYKSTHWRGKIYLLGIDLTNISSSKFYSDHDFVEITNPKENIRLRIDPSLHEFTRVGVMGIQLSK